MRATKSLLFLVCLALAGCDPFRGSTTESTGQYVSVSAELANAAGEPTLLAVEVRIDGKDAGGPPRRDTAVASLNIFGTRFETGAGRHTLTVRVVSQTAPSARYRLSQVNVGLYEVTGLFSGKKLTSATLPDVESELAANGAIEVVFDL
jgi:hypothetical protein